MDRFAELRAKARKNIAEGRTRKVDVDALFADIERTNDEAVTIAALGGHEKAHALSKTWEEELATAEPFDLDSFMKDVSAT